MLHKLNLNNMKKLRLILVLLGMQSSWLLQAQVAEIQEYHSDEVPCVTESQYKEFIEPLLMKNIKMLDSIKLSKQIDPAAKMAGGTVYLNWPLRMDEDYSNRNGVYSYFYINNFADLDDAEDFDDDGAERLDWMCFEGTEAKNYDQHNGADISPFPFTWQMMDDEAVDVIAAADGEVIYREDGYFDRNCAKPHILGAGGDFNGGYYGNFIALRHDDMSITIYAHLKQGTVANYEVGDYLTQGTYLGKVGSSGNSTGPHLHFEYRITEGSGFEEPWYDPDGCNYYPGESRWVSQVPYEDPQLIRISTHYQDPIGKDCVDYEAGENEDVYESNHFATSDIMLISVAMRDFFVGDEISINIYNASDVLQESLSHTATSDYEAVRIPFTVFLFGYSSGTYKIRVLHNGKYYYHYFTVNCPSAASYVGTQSGVKGYLNGDNINSTVTIPGVSSNIILYEAENYIKLNTGFKATQNCSFRAKIDACTIDGIREVNEPVSDEHLLIFPNPNTGVFSVVVPQTLAENGQLVVYDHTGKVIYTQQVVPEQRNVMLDLSLEAKGIYFIRIADLQSSETEKVVIQQAFY